MKKAGILLGVLLLALFSSAFSLKEWRESVYEEIQAETIREVKKTFKKEIQIGKTEGIVVGQIIFRDVVIPDFGRAQTVYLNFNPAKFAYQRDIVPAITKITIEEGEFEVKRDRAARWNVQSLFPPADEPGTPPPPFQAQLILKNCKLNYEDQHGFRKDFESFSGSLREINGEINLQRKDRIYFFLSGEINEKLPSTQLKVTGSSNLKTGKFIINVAADKLKLEKWGNYLVPFDPLTFTGGEADLALNLSPPKIRGWPLSLAGNFSFSNASGRFGDYKIEKSSGKLSISDDTLVLKDFHAQINELPFLINGNFSDFEKQNMDFEISFTKTGLEKIVSLFPETKTLDLTGLTDGFFKIQGTVPDPRISGNVKIPKGTFYNQDFSGRMTFSLRHYLLKLDEIDIDLYKGKLSGAGNIDFSKKPPAISLKAELRKIDLASLSQNSPGIVGQASGELDLSGPLNRLKGSLSASLANARFLGQPIDDLFSSFRTEDRDIYLENFSATSKTSALRFSGQIARDLTFDFQAQAMGLKISGMGILGTMEARVDLFQGDINGKLDEKFFASPLRNLNASGEVSLSEVEIGEQHFDLARGSLTIGGGLLRIEKVTFQEKQSSLQASGQTGIGVSTDLEIVGKKLNLADLKILNYLLPEEAKNPTGSADINIKITGELSEETRIVSFDHLLDLSAQGAISLANVKTAEFPLIQGRVNFLWEKRRFSISESSLKTEKSNFKFNLSYVNQNKIKGEIQGIFDFWEFKDFTSKYGRLDGKLGINLILEGEAGNPEMAASFWMDDFRFNQIEFDKIEGSLDYFNYNLSLIRPLLLVRDQNQYEIFGAANLEGFSRNRQEESYLDLNLRIIKADLSSSLILFEQIRDEFFRKLAAPIVGGKSKIDFSALGLPTVRHFMRLGKIVFYAQDGERKYFLESWGDIFKELKKEIAITPAENLGGELLGNISLKGIPKNLSGKIDGQIKNGFFRDYEFENLRVEALLEKEKIKIEKLELFKKRGKTSARGEIGFDGNLLLNITAQNMPLDILRILFKREFKGSFNLNATLDGPARDPNISATISGKNATLADIYFDRLSLSFTKKNARVFIHELTLIEKGNISKIYGSIPLSFDDQINLKLSLKENALGLFNLFLDEMKWIKGTSSASLEIGGVLNELIINGEIELKDTIIYVKTLDSEIKKIEGKGVIQNSQLKIASLTGIWQGKRTREYPNFLGLAGIIHLNKILADKSMAWLDLNFSPTLLYADLPNLYSGELQIKAARLLGPFYFDFSAGPTLQGKAEINNSLITLAQNKKKGKAPPLNYDLTLALNKNVYAVMGDITTLDLSNIFINLGIACEELKISGSLAYPSLLGKVFLGRGTVTIFNREFTLLSPEQQKKYYPLDVEKIKDNVAVFTGEEGREGVMPEVIITAKVEVENLEEDAEGKLVRQKVIVLSRLSGVIGATEKERGLKISFDGFIEDKTKAPYQIQPAGYSEQAIKVMLLPDFIKSLTGIDKGEKVDTNLVVADYLSSRVQTFVFRGIERELEQKLGLESLTLEYNFGKDIRQAMGVTETKILEGEKPDWRVGFVKGFFDKFYVDVNYAQFGTQTEVAQETFNYQLTYKLTPIWSIIYYREPISLQEPASGYEKYTLRIGFSFW